MSTKKLYMIYFMTGVMGTIAIQMLPLVMNAKGYDASQVTLLLSIVFLASIFQPLIGYLTRTKVGTKSMLKTLAVVMTITALIIFSITNYYFMIVIVLLFSIARLSISPIYDSYTTRAIETHNINYGLCRSGASFGFGIGMAIYTVIAAIFDLDYIAAFALVAILALVATLIISSLPTDENNQQSTADVTVEDKSNVLLVVLLIAMYTLYFGALNLRITYISTYYVEFGYTTSFISLTTFIMVIPEILFLPLYNRLFSNFNKVLLLFCSIVLGIIQIILYIMFTESPAMLMFASLFNGLQIMIFFPTYFGLLQQNLGKRNSAFGFVMNVTMMSLFVGIFNLFVIRPIYINSQSTISIFYLIIGLGICALIPLFIYHLKTKTNVH
ncbi:MFS transporter [Mollicutes bacterium LVI A0078]|nr:MFS transporter [Mollicutes bacterium LVI A0075]WOO91539.1 MFS transporter [Mollicutes bacterium LVI A0078]